MIMLCKKFINFFWALTAATCLQFSASQSLNAATLVGWAQMPTHTFAKGPTTRQFYGEKGSKNKQIVQGFSAAQKAKNQDTFYFLEDNGFGGKANSADYVLRMYEVNVNFSEKGHQKNNVDPIRFIDINDASKKLSFKIQADYKHYYDQNNYPPVDDTIRQNRLLTGADIDPESFQIDKHGNLWIGDEFGPFLIKVNASGTVLRSEIALDGVMSADNPYIANAKPNLGGSSGFEAMAINPAGDKLYPLLEHALAGDPDKLLRMYEFDINTEHYTGRYYQYRLDDQGSSATDMLAVNDNEFLVLERSASKDKPFKKIFLIDITQLENGALVNKKELVDLMRLKDPDDLNADGKLTYAFPYSHVEALLIIDKNTLLVANDNNYNTPTSFIKIQLDHPLTLSNFTSATLNTSHWQENKFFLGKIHLGDHSFFGWITVYAYFIAGIRAGYKAKVAKKTKQNTWFWLTLAVFLILLGLNRQFDLLHIFTDLLRQVANTLGWYEYRQPLQLAFIIATGLMLSILLMSLRLIIFKSWQRYKLTWLAITLLLFFIAIRTTSYHYIDLFIYKSIGGLRAYQGLEIMCICLIFISTFFQKKQ